MKNRTFNTVVALMLVFAFVFAGFGAHTSFAKGNVECPEGTTLIAKFNWEDSGWVFEKGIAGAVTLSGDAYTGTWASTVYVTAVITKGATSNNTVSFPAPGALFGSYDNTNLFTNKGNLAQISNIKFCGGGTPPPPGDCRTDVALDGNYGWTPPYDNGSGTYVVKAWATNTSTTNTYTMGLASYKKYDELYENQVLFDSDQKDLGPGEYAEFYVELPACAAQVDFFCGPVIQELGEDGLYGPRLLLYYHTSDPYCVD